MEHFRKSLLTDHPDLKEKAYFNLGNTFYQAGKSKEESDILEAIKDVEQAIQNVEKALQLNKNDKNAQRNLDFFKDELNRFKHRLKENPPKKQPEKKESPEDDKKSSGQDSQPSSPQESEGQKEGQRQQPQSGQPKPQPKSSPDSKDQKVAGAGDLEKKENFKTEDVKKMLEQYQSNEEPTGILYLQRGPSQERPVGKDW